MATVYRKTARGSEAIANRTIQLSPRERALLIVVDGKRSAEEILAAGGAFAPGQDLVQGLLSAGLIESVTVTEQSSPSPRHKPDPGVLLANGKRQAVRRINDLLGPSGDDICIRLEASRTIEEFRTELRRAGAVLQQAVGAPAASEFAHEVERTLSN